MGNVAPSSGIGGLADKYPLSAYTLDYHVDVGLTDLDGVPPTIAQWASAQIWMAIAWLLKLTIDIFAWAFSLDLINGPHGALVPVGNAVRSVYDNVIGRAWLVTAFTALGMWLVWKALVQRRHSEAFGAAAVSIACVVAGMIFVFQPAQTIGEASHWSNDLSTAFLSATNQGNVSDGDAAKRSISDHLFETLVYRPWVVLEFGGLRHCVDTDKIDEHGYPRPVAPNDPTRDVCRDHLVTHGGFGGYAPRFLAQPASSDERTAEYEAIRDGAVPATAPTNPGPGRPPKPRDVSPTQFNGWHVDKNDSPAVDIQQAGGAFQRLVLVLVIAFGAIGAVAFLAFLCLAIILAATLALVLFAFAPVALIAGALPGHGHDMFRSWLGRLGIALFIKVLFSLALGITVLVSASLTAATGALPFLISFGLQAAFFWALLIYRKKLVHRATRSAIGHRAADRIPPAIRRQGHEAMTHPFTALAGAAMIHRRRSGASAEEPKHTSNEYDLGGPEDRPGSDWHRDGRRDGPMPDSVSPPSSAGREYSPPGPPPTRKAAVQSPEPNQENGVPLPRQGKPHIAARTTRPESPGDAAVVDPDRDTSAHPRVTVRVVPHHPSLADHPPTPEDMREARDRRALYARDGDIDPHGS